MNFISLLIFLSFLSVEGQQSGSYLVAVGGCLVHHIQNPERAGPLHAAPRVRTCREEAGEGVRGEERVRG